MNKINNNDFIQNGKLTRLGTFVLILTIASVTNKVLRELFELEEVNDNEQSKKR